MQFPKCHFVCYQGWLDLWQLYFLYIFAQTLLFLLFLPPPPSPLPPIIIYFIYIYIYIYICMYIYIYSMYLRFFWVGNLILQPRVYVCVLIPIYSCVYISACVCVCLNACVFVCIYICMCKHVSVWCLENMIDSKCRPVSSYRFSRCV